MCLHIVDKQRRTRGWDRSWMKWQKDWDVEKGDFWNCRCCPKTSKACIYNTLWQMDMFFPFFLWLCLAFLHKRFINKAVKLRVLFESPFMQFPHWIRSVAPCVSVCMCLIICDFVMLTSISLDYTHIPFLAFRQWEATHFITEMPFIV